MAAGSAVGIVLGAWGAGLSSYLAYRAISRERPRMTITVHEWTESTPLEKAPVIAGISVTIANTGTRPLTVREVHFEMPDGSGFSGKQVDRPNSPSAVLPSEIQDGQALDLHYLFADWMRDSTEVRVKEARGMAFRHPMLAANGNPLASQAFVLTDALRRIDQVAVAFGLKPGHEVQSDPLAYLEGRGFDAMQVVELRLFLDWVAQRMRVEPPEFAVARAAIERDHRHDEIATLRSIMEAGESPPQELMEKLGSIAR
jgi:hypothetical protein